MSRNRICSDPEPQFNGLDCSGNITEKDSCSENHCPSKTDNILLLSLIYGYQVICVFPFANIRPRLF